MRWIVILISAIFAVIVFVIKQRKSKREYEKATKNKTEIQMLTERVHKYIEDNLNDEGVFEEYFENDIAGKREHGKQRLLVALRTCCDGTIQPKLFLKGYIKDLVINELSVDDEMIKKIVPYKEKDKIKTEYKFRFLLNDYYKKYDKNAFSVMFEELLEKRKCIEKGYIDENDIETAFDEWIEKNGEPIKNDAIEIITDIIYETYGHGVIDLLRDMNIDGISAGVGGMTQPDVYERINNDGKELHEMYFDNIWMMFRGITFRLKFLSFKNEKEMIRVTRSLLKYHSDGELSANNPKMITNMKDGSRVTAVRPPFSECYAFFIRKFPKDRMSLPDFLGGKNFCTARYISSLVAGGINIAVTGCQGGGKTTLLKALIEYIPRSSTVRIEESVFELWMRELYPDRNILTFRETEQVSAVDGINLMKKTDAQVMLFGEIADIDTAVLVIELAQVSEQQIFTHHAVDTEKMISYFRNALLRKGVFREETLALMQVVSSITVNIHIEKDIYGNRHISFVDEIISEDNGYSIRQLVRYIDGEYCIVAMPSDKTMAKIKSRLTTDEFERFTRSIDWN